MHCLCCCDNNPKVGWIKYILSHVSRTKREGECVSPVQQSSSGLPPPSPPCLLQPAPESLTHSEPGSAVGSAGAQCQQRARGSSWMEPVSDSPAPHWPASSHGVWKSLVQTSEDAADHHDDVQNGWAVFYFCRNRNSSPSCVPCISE